MNRTSAVSIQVETAHIGTSHRKLITLLGKLTTLLFFIWNAGCVSGWGQKLVVLLSFLRIKLIRSLNIFVASIPSNHVQNRQTKPNSLFPFTFTCLTDQKNIMDVEVFMCVRANQLVVLNWYSTTISATIYYGLNDSARMLVWWPFLMSAAFFLFFTKNWMEVQCIPLQRNWRSVHF